MIARSLPVVLLLAMVGSASAHPADDTTARVRKITADTQKQTETVGALHQRVDSLEAQSAKASAELAARDKAIADLREQLRQAKAASPAPSAAATTAGPRR